METASTRIGELDQVEVFQQRGTGPVLLSAVGEVEAPPVQVHNALLAQLDPRLIASLAEGWTSGVCPDPQAFALRARWTIGRVVGLTFKLTDDRGAITRTGNWVIEASGSWLLEPIDHGLWTRAIYRVQIQYASVVPRFTVRTGALHDLPTLFRTLRDAVGPQRSVALAVGNSGR
jgi:hypothetical protein